LSVPKDCVSLHRAEKTTATLFVSSWFLKRNKGSKKEKKNEFMVSRKQQERRILSGMTKVYPYGIMVEVIVWANFPMLVPPNFWTIQGLDEG
jgi:hypothetical protein